MLFWAIRASIPTKNYENKTGCVFFHCASDGNAPGRRNTTQKSKNNEKLIFSETRFFQVWPNRAKAALKPSQDAQLLIPEVWRDLAKLEKIKFSKIVVF